MDSRKLLGIAVRTLLTAGYTIVSSRNNPRYIEINCERVNILGATTYILLALTEENEFTQTEIEDLVYTADGQHRSLVLVAKEPSENNLTWDDFFNLLGGQVPSWRALTQEYKDLLLTLSRNELLPGLSGEAWLLFEDLVAEGLEFIFGRRVRRLGGKKRGKAVSDMIAQLPSQQLIVVDSKAYSNGFDVNHASLRALGEYSKRQIERQASYNKVYSALVVSFEFKQGQKTLLELSLNFRAEYGIPVAFFEVNDFNSIVDILRDKVNYRNSIRWGHIFKGGKVSLKDFEAEIDNVSAERYLGGEE